MTRDDAGTRTARMLRPFSLAVLAVLAAALTGCLAYPHPRDVVLLSRVDGQLHEAGAPLRDRVLTMNSVWNTAPCADPIATTRSDAAGRFRFEEITERRWLRTVILAPSSPTYTMTLCLRTGEEARPILGTSIWATLPRRLELRCDLAAVDERGDHCTIEDWEGYNFTDRVPSEQRGARGFRSTAPDADPVPTLDTHTPS